MADAKVCWIEGCSILRRRAINQILSDIGDYDLYTFNIDVSAEFVFEKLNSVDMFDMIDSDTRSVYILKSIPEFDGSAKSSNKRFVEMLSFLSENQLVIIDGVDHRYNKTVYGKIKKIGKVLEFADAIAKKDAPTFLSIEFNRIEKTIEDDDISFLLEYLGTGDTPKYSADYLCNVVYKFEQFLGKRKQISREDILAICNVDRKTVIWDILGHLDKKDFNSAMIAFETLSKSKRDFRAAVESIVYPMMWKYRLVMYGKELEREKIGFSKALEQIALLTKNNEDNTRMYSDGFARKIIQGWYNESPVIDLYSRADLYKIYKALTFHMTNMRFYTESELRLMVTILFLVICNEIDFQALKDANNLFWSNKVCRRL